MAAARLRDPAVRLLTLTGPGGVGKSRLALATAEALLPDHPDGVWFVPLAPLDDPALVPAAVARPLGIAEHGTQPLRDTVRDALREHQVLLLLDNLEHLLPATDFIEEVLAACPGLKALVTSRAALRSRWGHEAPVPPLALPDTRLTDQAALAHVPAVALFAARAAAVRPDFRLAPQNAPAVAAICRRLDGLPLAFELAAARARLLSPAALLERLDAPFRLLTGGSPGRQQTLRDTLAWSHDLLDPDERRLFRRLSAFPGGCAIAAAEAICAEPGAARDVLDLAESLVAQNLVRRIDGPDGAPRLTLFETIREYGWEQLAATGETETIRDRHAAYYLALAEEAAPHLTAAAQEVWFPRLELELDNLRAALRRLLDRGDALAGLRLAGALWRFWYLRGYFAEGRRWLEAFLALPCDESVDANSAARALALYGASTLAALQRDLAAAAHGEASLALRRRLGDRADVAATLNGATATLAGDYARAAALLAEAVALFRDTGERAGLASALTNLGVAQHQRGEDARAGTLHEESLAVARATGDRWGTARALALARGAADEAVARGEEAVAILRAIEGGWELPAALSGLASGDRDRAAALWREVLERDAATGVRDSLPAALEGLAALAADREPARAARLLAAASALRDRLVLLLPATERAAHERQRAAIRAALGAASFATAADAGRALAAEAAVAAALGGTPSPASPANPRAC